MFCNKCGDYNEDDTRFCIHCGSLISGSGISEDYNPGTNNVSLKNNSKSYKRNDKACIVASLVCGILLGIINLVFTGINAVGFGFFIGILLGILGVEQAKIISAALVGGVLYALIQLILSLIFFPGDLVFLFIGVIGASILGAVIGGIGGFIGKTIH